MTNSNTTLNNEQAINNTNRQLAVNTATSDKVATTECNYSDNYYGDQLCRPIESTQTNEHITSTANVESIAKNDVAFNNVTDINTRNTTDCNYNNNYYGDQLCKPAVAIQTQVLNNKETSHTHKNYQQTSCNYNNDYYGDQLCKTVAS